MWNLIKCIFVPVVWATITLSPGHLSQALVLHSKPQGNKDNTLASKQCPSHWTSDALIKRGKFTTLQSACRSTWIQVCHKDKQSITRHQAQFGCSYVTTRAETDWGMHEVVVQSQSLEEPWKTMTICHFKSVLEVKLWTQLEIFIDFTVERRLVAIHTCLFHCPWNVQKVVLLPPQTEMAGHHSLVPLVATVHLKIHQSLCIQASKYMYMMFRYGPLSLYHQITTAPTTHICSRLHVLVAQATHTHTHIPDSLLQILHTVIYTWSRCIRLWTLLLYFNKEKVHMHEGTYMHATANTKFAQYISSFANFMTTICVQYGLQTQQSNHTPTPQLSTTAWSRRFFSHIQCVGDINWQTVHAHIHKHTLHKDTTIISFKNSILQLITPQLVPVQITLQTPTLNQDQRHRLAYPAIPPRMKLTPLGMAPGGTTLFGEVAASFRFSVSSLVAMVLAVGLVKEKCEETAGQWPFIARGKSKAVPFRSLLAPVWDRMVWGTSQGIRGHNEKLVPRIISPWKFCSRNTFCRDLPWNKMVPMQPVLSW